jgi:hypothetical protein
VHRQREVCFLPASRSLPPAMASNLSANRLKRALGPGAAPAPMRRAIVTPLPGAESHSNRRAKSILSQNNQRNGSKPSSMRPAIS